VSKRDHLQEHSKTSGGESTNAGTNLGTVVGLKRGGGCWGRWGLASTWSSWGSSARSNWGSWGWWGSWDHSRRDNRDSVGAAGSGVVAGRSHWDDSGRWAVSGGVCGGVASRGSSVAHSARAVGDGQGGRASRGVGLVSLDNRGGTRADSCVCRNYRGDNRATIDWGDWGDWRRDNSAGGTNNWGRCLGELAGAIGDGESLAGGGRVCLAISCDGGCCRAEGCESSHGLGHDGSSIVSQATGDLVESIGGSDEAEDGEDLDGLHYDDR